jgi:hypothetical protein
MIKNNPDPEVTSIHTAVQRHRGPEWHWLILAEVSAAFMILSMLGCSSAREEKTDTKEEWRGSFDALLPTASLVGETQQVPVRVDFVLAKKATATTSEEATHSIDAPAAGRAIGAAMQAAVPGGSAIGQLLGYVFGGGGIAAAGAIALRNKNTVRALADAVAFGRDVTDAKTPAEVASVRDIHRVRQLRNGTNDRIKTLLR